jgi:hypothetical protein
MSDITNVFRQTIAWVVIVPILILSLPPSRSFFYYSLSLVYKIMLYCKGVTPIKHHYWGDGKATPPIRHYSYDFANGFSLFSLCSSWIWHNSRYSLFIWLFKRYRWYLRNVQWNWSFTFTDIIWCEFVFSTIQELKSKTWFNKSYSDIRNVSLRIESFIAGILEREYSFFFLSLMNSWFG